MPKKDMPPPIASRLDGAMALLDARSRQIMKLWLEGRSLGEIAETIGLPEQAVAVIRGSSILRLRDLLAQQPRTDEADFQPSKKAV